MNRAKYMGDGRYERVLERMDLLGIMDVSTTRQGKNGTIVWKLPIKYGPDRFIEVASFKTGYVRNQNCGHSNYQLNKRCDSEPQYYELPNGTYNKYTTRTCKLIPNEIDRLEYLIAYCLKNYYIKNANQVANGGYVEQWYHDHQLEIVTSNKVRELQDRIYELESQVNIAGEKLSATKVRQDVSVIVNGHRYKVL